ncbi:Uncharacterized protein APZ42_029051 [Daphnia magna]|uniref:Uncharacterized protein n=1 Tax=Daphnia magna TaxID=35525 RepID=A0A0P4Y5J4_9CRUS|nr:Uncharacterized protein APZ42_029051 [Daphnia magna]
MADLSESRTSHFHVSSFFFILRVKSFRSLKVIVPSSYTTPVAISAPEFICLFRPPFDICLSLLIRV